MRRSGTGVVDELGLERHCKLVQSIYVVFYLTRPHGIMNPEIILYCDLSQGAGPIPLLIMVR